MCRAVAEANTALFSKNSPVPGSPAVAASNVYVKPACVPVAPSGPVGVNSIESAFVSTKVPPLSTTVTVNRPNVVSSVMALVMLNAMKFCGADVILMSSVPRDEAVLSSQVLIRSSKSAPLDPV